MSSRWRDASFGRCTVTGFRGLHRRLVGALCRAHWSGRQKEVGAISRLSAAGSRTVYAPKVTPRGRTRRRPRHARETTAATRAPLVAAGANYRRVLHFAHTGRWPLTAWPPPNACACAACEPLQATQCSEVRRNAFALALCVRWRPHAEHSYAELTRLMLVKLAEVVVTLRKRYNTQPSAHKLAACQESSKIQLRSSRLSTCAAQAGKRARD